MENHSSVITDLSKNESGSDFKITATFLFIPTINASH
jgi:hypothetical protein